MLGKSNKKLAITTTKVEKKFEIPHKYIKFFVTFAAKFL